MVLADKQTNLEINAKHRLFGNFGEAGLRLERYPIAPCRHGEAQEAVLSQASTDDDQRVEREEGGSIFQFVQAKIEQC